MPALPNLVYAEFDTTQTNLLADLRTNILASAAWTRPNAAGKPDTYKCTTTRGADMVFDLTDSAILTYMLTIGVWRSYDGTVFADKTQRYLWWRNGGGAASNPLHVVLSCSKEHMFFSIEGPRATETGAENSTTGGTRQSFFMCDLVPYHDADLTPAIFAGGQMTNAFAADINLSPYGHVSRGAQAPFAPWGVGRLLTLAWPTNATGLSHNVQRQTLDGNYYLAPYVVASDADGIRGRLATFFNAGYVAPDLQPMDAPNAPPLGSKVTYDGQLYKMVATTRTSQSSSVWNQFGGVTNGSGSPRAIAVAVPST